MRMPGAALVCHVLLLEAPGGLVLVDTGFGLADVADPGRRLGAYRHVTKPVLQPAGTAIRQIERLGFLAGDVRHVLMTHLDSDHAGGLADFPAATVHVSEAEWSAARNPATFTERTRYRAVQWEHGPRIVTHPAGDETWEGFAGVRPLPEVADGVLLVPLPGHTRGHTGFAIRGGDGWLLHAGDAFYYRAGLLGEGQPVSLTAQERAVATDRRAVRETQARLAALIRRGDPALTVVSAHDPALLPSARG